MAEALSWLLVLFALVSSNCIDVMAYSILSRFSEDLTEDDQTFEKLTISGSADIFGERSKELKVPDMFQLSLLLVRLRHRLSTYEVFKTRPRLFLPKVRVDQLLVDLLRRRLQGMNKSSGTAPLILKGAADDSEHLRLFLAQAQ